MEGDKFPYQVLLFGPYFVDFTDTPAVIRDSSTQDRKATIGEMVRLSGTYDETGTGVKDCPIDTRGAWEGAIF